MGVVIDVECDGDSGCSELLVDVSVSVGDFVRDLCDDPYEWGGDFV